MAVKVLVIVNEHGEVEQVVTDAEAEVIVVAEHAANDRLYRLSSAHTISADRVAEIINGDRIGSSSDERHAAYKNRILSAMEGKPHLKPVN